MATSRSDLVAHFHLDAEIHDDYTIIKESVRGQRNVHSEVKWVRSSRRPFAGGGFGTVWLEHEEGNKSNLRAVKVIRKPTTQRNFQQDFEEELWALAALSKFHHNVAEFFGWWEDDYEVCLALEYFPHRDLANCIKGPLPEKEAREITAQILEALKIIHGMDITHRDLKPHNVLVAEPGPDWWVKIGDFGISKRAGQQTGMFTRQIGTVAFMAPEVLDDDSNEQYTDAVDIWAMGCMTYSFLMYDDLFAQPKMVTKYAKKELSLDNKWNNLTANQVGRKGIDFIKRLVSARAGDRPSAASALQLPWIQEAERNKTVRPAPRKDSAAAFRLRSPLQTVTSRPVDTTTSSWEDVDDTDKDDLVTQAKSKPRLQKPRAAKKRVETLRTEIPESSRQNETGRTLVEAVEDCAAKCKCIICSGCASHLAPQGSRGPRTEYITHSCGNGHFSGSPICQKCLVPGDLGFYKCPICREETSETFSRQGHQSITTSRATTESKTPPVAVAQPSVEKPRAYAEPPAQPDPWLGRSLSAPEVPRGPTPSLSPDPTNLLPTIAMLDSLNEMMASLTTSITLKCRGCFRDPTTESWVCIGCEEISESPLACTDCVPRSEATHRISGSSTLGRYCPRCNSSRCYLVTLSEYEAMHSPSLSSPLLYPTSSACSLACKCDECGTCVIRDDAHWKCGSCTRPKCGRCANVASGVNPIPWCSGPLCDSEMMFPAANGAFKPLPRRVIPAYFESLASIYARTSCGILGCACSKCGECSQRKYIYRCKPCQTLGSAYLSGPLRQVEHTCNDCMYDKLMVYRERPVCSSCEGSEFQTFKPVGRA